MSAVCRSTAAYIMGSDTAKPLHLIRLFSVHAAVKYHEGKHNIFIYKYVLYICSIV